MLGFVVGIQGQSFLRFEMTNAHLRHYLTYCIWVEWRWISKQIPIVASRSEFRASLSIDLMEALNCAEVRNRRFENSRNGVL
jgi:hypothetical protein